MLYEIMLSLHNFFEVDNVEGEYTIENGTVSLSFVKPGQYFRIAGSIFNDGVYQYPASDLTDEVFTGVISPLAIPNAFLSLVGEIEAWESENNMSGNFSSESYGGYSYTRATSNDGSAYSWRDEFKGRLKEWRKMM